MTEAEQMEREAREAINQYLKTVTYPVIWSDSDRIFTLGTCVLFQYGDRHFLLTAKHLFDEYEGQRFPYEGLVGPIGLGKAAPRELGNIVVHEANGPDAEFLDIVAIELLDKTFIQAIKKLWSFITVADFARPNSSSVYFVSGFPKDREKRFGEMVGAALMSLTTNECDTIPEVIEDYDAQLDIFCKYDATTRDFYRNDREVDSPWVGGVSGGPVFRVADEPPGIWTARSGTRFVGLQSGSTRTKNWLRIKSAFAVAVYFNAVIPEIGRAIVAHLNR